MSSAAKPRSYWLIGLIAVIALGAVAWQRLAKRELPPQANQAPATASAFVLQAPRPALPADEERYAAALWPIHSAVKQYALKMTFSGLSYAQGEIDAKTLGAKLSDVQSGFAGVATDFAQLQAPARLSEVHQQYAQALAWYQESVAEALKIRQNENRQHLIDAQEKSRAAGEALLKVGNTLWPSEYRPN